VVINALGIEAYGFTEVVSSSFKLTFLIIVIIILGCINGGAGTAGKIGTADWSTLITVYDDVVVDHWVAGFFMSLSIAAFAYVGVEIPAASALEARVPVGRDPRHNRVVGRTVQTTAIWGSVFAGALYVLAGILVSLNIKWDDPRLPRMPWVVVPTTTNSPSTPDSAFIIVAMGSGIPGLAGSLNIFLLFTALSCANTQLYVASRTLFALTRGLAGNKNQPFYIRWLAALGRTNRRKVPMRALMASCIFAWVPYLYLDPHNGNGTSIGTLLNVLAQMGSVGVVIVWTCECWAFLRFYYCVHEESDDLRSVSMVRRWNPGKNDLPDDYPYRGHGQPFTAYLAIAGCIFILFVASGASLWKQWDTNAFLSAYLAVSQSLRGRPN
jgi:amino acid transporter